MLLLREPDTAEKVALLGRAACFDVHAPEEAKAPRKAHRGLAEELGRYLHRPAGRASGPLLKVLLTNACRYNCLYCAFRRDLSGPRTAFRPEELASAFVEMHRKGLASGLFLSSGMAGEPLRTMGEMLRTAEILRHKHRFPGYLHLKILPGATDDYLEAACRLADRVSANLEAPNRERLAAICPEKLIQADLEGALHRVSLLREREPMLLYGTSTQFVVGAAGESDREILEASDRLYTESRLTRAHYSGFSPIPGTPLEDLAPTPSVRQRRLYQADALLRQYGFALGELPLEPEGNLPASRDPKLEWAERHPERFPVEVNRATRGDLLRVPGIGPGTADALLRRRRSDPITRAEQLRAFPGLVSRAGPYLLVDGRRLLPEGAVQMELWPSSPNAPRRTLP